MITNSSQREINSKGFMKRKEKSGLPKKIICLKMKDLVEKMKNWKIGKTSIIRELKTRLKNKLKGTKKAKMKRSITNISNNLKKSSVKMNYNLSLSWKVKRNKTRNNKRTMTNKSQTRKSLQRKMIIRLLFLGLQTLCSLSL